MEDIGKLMPHWAFSNIFRILLNWFFSNRFFPNEIGRELDRDLMDQRRFTCVLLPDMLQFFPVINTNSYSPITSAESPTTRLTPGACSMKLSSYSECNGSDR